MRVEHLRQWLIAATQDDSPDATNCLKVVAIVQAAFQDRKLAEECMWQTVVLIPKGEGDFRGVGIVKVLWKAIEILVNYRLTAALSFHDKFHGFWAGRGTVTAALEANLLQKLTAMRKAVIFEVFLDLRKSYEALDR